MIGSASMSARRPSVLTSCPSAAGLRPLIRPTTPVRPMPVMTSSQPNSFSRSATKAGRAMHLVEKLRMRMDILPPRSDIGLQIGDAIDDGH